MKTVRLQAAVAFWLHQQWQTRGWWAWLLWPLSGLALCYVLAKRRWYQLDTKRVYRAPVPVVVVGNLYVGGVGKTPVVIALVQQLLALGWRPGVISRGYGVKIGAAARVAQGDLDARVMGDEPTLIGALTNVPVGVHPNRRLACQTLLSTYPEIDIIVSDDGLQHLALARDLEIIVQDTRRNGNGWLLPAGPLREPPSRFNTVDLVLTRQALPPQCGTQLAATQTPEPTAIPQSPEAAHEPAEFRRTPKPPTQLRGTAQRLRSPTQLSMWLQVTGLHSIDKKINLSVLEFIKLQENKVSHAIAAISEPDRFFKSLTAAGILYQGSTGLPDHHPLNADFFKAQQADLLLITAKDAVKCRALRDPRIWVVATEAVFSDPLWATKLAKQLPYRSRSHPD